MNPTIRRTTVSLLILLIGLLLNQAPSFAGELISWSSDEGISRLEKARVKSDFFALSPHFEGQSNKVFCGVASMAIVANALRVDRDATEIPLDSSRISKQEMRFFPKGDWSPLFHRYTQESILTGQGKTRMQIMGEPYGADSEGDYGMKLADLDALATSLKLQTQTTYVNEELLAKQSYTQVVKQHLIDALSNNEQFVIINYSRKPLNQRGDGHFSPLAAYHAASDSFLIMDVSNTFQTWVWVESKQLMQAMARIDKQNSRGFIVISEDS
ncbi:phytochelatin synthase-like protein [Shewanella sediminis HAW-EB3]|uniref:glutathione gamma-glutamylcysteinyltransferase n=1 Tax=Shewanella sediminis (strain HAW-EB3) TaxID=425104 RepID=A8FUA1_SHESH|nr:phytochelatin synthase family protein [Shewanella sediminis]ABV36424.1 phytochelatin synthase-like protein [Shewanella sediminis HAW-EB3]